MILHRCLSSKSGSTVLAICNGPQTVIPGLANNGTFEPTIGVSVIFGDDILTERLGFKALSGAIPRK
jgi:hypothetical protein